MIRQATLDDAPLLLEWRNDPLTREMSKDREPVEWDRHIAWLSARLARENPNLFIAESNGNPVGTFRVDGDEISYTIAPTLRGNGVGLKMLTAAKEMFGPLRAEIFSRNVASIKLATRAGMLVHILEDA